MFDVKTGNLILDDASEPLGEDTQREQFLASARGKRAQSLVMNQDWRSYSIKGSFADGTACSVALYFFGTWLQQLHVWIADESIDPNAEDCGKRQKEVNDRWLAANNVSTTKQYSWGMVGSVTDHWDPRDSSIIITYKKHTAPPFNSVFEKQ